MEDFYVFNEGLESFYANIDSDWSCTECFTSTANCEAFYPQEFGLPTEPSEPFYSDSAASPHFVSKEKLLNFPLSVGCARDVCSQGVCYYYLNPDRSCWFGADICKLEHIDDPEARMKVCCQIRQTPCRMGGACAYQERNGGNCMFKHPPRHITGEKPRLSSIHAAEKALANNNFLQFEVQQTSVNTSEAAFGSLEYFSNLGICYLHLTPNGCTIDNCSFVHLNPMCRQLVVEKLENISCFMGAYCAQKELGLCAFKHDFSGRAQGGERRDVRSVYTPPRKEVLNNLCMKNISTGEVCEESSGCLKKHIRNPSKRLAILAKCQEVICESSYSGKRSECMRKHCIFKHLDEDGL